MATYREISGRAIQSVTTDPSESVAEGQIWYNTNSDTFKSVVTLEAVSSANPMNTSRSQISGGGIQTAAFVAGGTTSSPASGTTTTENYDGSGWTNSAAMSNPRVYFGATGPQTSGLAVAGGPPFSPSPGGAQNNVEEYDGEGWTAGGAIPTNVWTNKCFGTQTAAVSVGSEPNTTNYVFNYDGSSWTNGGTMNSIRSYSGTGGPQTAGIVFAGANPSAPVGKATEFYDGSSWTSGPLCSVISYSMFCGGGQTSALKGGGQLTAGPPYVTNVIEKYDGSAWSTSPATLATARGYSSGQTQNSPNNSAGLFSGGTTTNVGTGHTGATEEFNISANVITSAAWTSGGALPATVAANQGVGIQTAALSISGQPNSPGTAATNATNHYNGTSWTAGGSLSAGAASYGGASSTKGSETAALYWNGYNPTPSPAGYRATVSSYNGSSWTAQPTYPGSANGYGSGAGTSTAALGMGGYLVSNCYESDGSYNWTAGGALPTSKYAMAAGGPQTAAIGAGGYGTSPGSVTIQSTADTYNGTSWTSISVTPITQAAKNGCFGTSSSDFMVAGGTPARSTCIHYNGTAWSTRPSISTGRHAGSGAGASGTSGLIAGGNTGSFTTATEEFTGETTSLNVNTLTQS